MSARNAQSITNENVSMVCQYNAAGNINVIQKVSEVNKISEKIEFHLPKLTESFRGRDDEMQTIKEWFFRDNHNMVTICGCAGYGKTELAKHFVRQCKRDGIVTNILWMDAETPDKLLHSFKNLAKLIGLPEVDDITLVQMVYQSLGTNSTIIVFDNATSRREIREFESEGACLCLVTSHVQDWGQGVPSLKLHTLSLNSALDVLRAELQEHFKLEDIELYKHLAELLSRVPLALQVAAAYIRQEFIDLGDHFCLREYVQCLEISSDEVINKSFPESSANIYNKSVSQAINVSLCKIQTSDKKYSKLAYEILHICAYLYAEKITYSDLLSIPHINNLLEKCQNSNHDLKRASSILSNYSFISDTNNQITVHRLIQSTLILKQNEIFKNIHNEFYLYCLEYLLTDDINLICHRPFILKFESNRLNTFKYFFSVHKSYIVDNDNFLKHLVATGCVNFFCEIFKDLGNDSVNIINKHNLLHETVLKQQHDLLNLLLQFDCNLNQRSKRGDTVLHIATENVDLHTIKILTCYNVDINAVDAIGDSILHRVIAASGKPQNINRSSDANEMLRWLVSHGARTDAVTWHGWTLLHTAARAHCVDLIRYLVVELELNINAIDEDGRTPLHHVTAWSSADRDKKLRTVTCLLDLGARTDIVDSWGRTPIQHAHVRGPDYLAAYLENPTEEQEILQTNEIVHMLRTAVAAGDTVSLTRQLNELGDRAVEVATESYLLHVSARHKQHEVLEFLLAHDIDVNSRDDKNTTALLLAALELDLHAMQILISHNAATDVTDAAGDSVLHKVIAASGFPQNSDKSLVALELLKFLVENGARTDAVTWHGRTLLHRAARAHSTDLIRCLVHDFNLDVDAVDEAGKTPLYYVTAWTNIDADRRLQTAKCLLELGARKDVIDRLGKTPAQHARRCGLDCLATYLEN